TEVAAVSGHHLEAPYSITFTMGYAPDTASPSVVAVSVPSGQDGVPPNAPIAVAFSEPLDRTTLASGLALRYGSVAVEGGLAFGDGDRRIVFTPKQPLTANAAYSFETTAALRDPAGNILANPGSVSFTTGPDVDNTPPFVEASDPANGAVDVGRRPVVRVKF